MTKSARGYLYVLLAIGLLLPTTTGCQPTGAQDMDGSTVAVAALKESIAGQLRDAQEKDDRLPGASIYILAPTLGLDWGTGVGRIDPTGSDPFTSAHPIRISSVTKPFVAAAVLRLHEQGKVDLDAPISRYLSQEHIQILRRGPYDPEALTIRHLLTHTSGLVDTFATKSFEDYMEMVLAGGAPRSFSLEEQLQRAVLGGEPTGAPGERQRYTDTGYILLGAMLETLTGADMATATRTLSGRDNLELPNTWWEILEQAPAGALPRARQFYGDFDGDGFGDEPFDLYGGGGMISSAEDLARYFWALVHGAAFEDPATLEQMKAIFEPEIFEGNRELLDRHGLQAFEIDGHILYGHGGWWGVGVYYSPEHDVLVAANWLQQLSGAAMSERARAITADVLRLAQTHATSQ